MPKENKTQEIKIEEWKYTLEKTGPAVTTFYEPKEFPPKLKENLRYLGLLYQNTSQKESGK